MRYWFILCCLLVAHSIHANELIITTSPWQPYVNEKSKGTAVQLLEQIFSQDDTKIIWMRQNYDLAFEQVYLGKKVSSFPYFKTPNRAEKVLYSNAIFEVSSYIYFNRQFNQQITASNLTKFRIGKVAGYSYGENIDALVAKAQVFSDEESALRALLMGKIDYLPMTESVMHYMLNNQFSEQMLLIKPLENIHDRQSLHLIATKSAEGQALITRVNALIKQVEHLQSLTLAPEALRLSPDIAKLITSEGYPAILAQSDLSDTAEFYTLPQGTKVLVIQWSEKLLKPSKSDRIYKNMMDVSKVVILNGPLVGKEVFVRNMHIELI